MSISFLIYGFLPRVFSFRSSHFNLLRVLFLFRVFRVTCSEPVEGFMAKEISFSFLVLCSWSSFAVKNICVHPCASMVEYIFWFLASSFGRTAVRPYRISDNLRESAKSADNGSFFLFV